MEQNHSDKAQKIMEIARGVLKDEAAAIELAASRLTDNAWNDLRQIFESLMKTDGNLIFCGVGKSGIIGKKLASTFSSLGLPSYSLHPVEALHGDLGRVRKNDAIVFLSKSGTTEEIIKLLPYLTIEKSMRIGLLGAMNSPIAKDCGVLLDCSVDREACINNQAPTTSSTLALAMGDAMAVVYEYLTGLSKEGFAINHPSGLLGKSLRVKVRDLMLIGNSCAIVSEKATLKDVILAMTANPVGGCAIVNDKNELMGIMVEGDIRRSLASEKNQGLAASVSEIMTKSPITIGPDSLALDALRLMEKRERLISILPVVENKKFLGMIRLHDLLKEGFLLENS
jgi:arabinose-5-phosphate isomerase